MDNKVFNVIILNQKQIKQINNKCYKTKLLVISEFVKPLFQKNGNKTMKQPNGVCALNEQITVK